MKVYASLLALVPALLAACGQPAATSADTGTSQREDAGPPEAADSGEDAGSGLDAAAPTPDAAERPDGAVEAPDAAEPGLDASDGLDASLPPDAACQGCVGYTGASAQGRMPAALVEASGLATSAAHPGVLFAHNDSGDSAHFYALDGDGTVLGEFVLAGATAVDWEDIAIGPCPAGSCVYLGDFGDNNQVRTDYALYRVPVPDVDVGDDLGAVSVAWERLPFQYPAGTKWNAETLLVHPRTGDVYVVNKLSAGKASTVFKFPQPLTPGVQATLTQVAVLPVPKLTDLQLTGGDIHPCGDAMLLRTYNRLYEFRLPAGAASFDAIFTTPAYGTVPAAIEPQGEAVAYQPGGRGYVTVSESVGGAPVFLNVHSCQ